MYVGSATWLGKRCNTHFWDLKKNKHPNIILQRAYNKYGAANFTFSVLEYCSVDKLIEREQYWIDTINCVNPNGYNIKAIAGNTAGVIRTAETIAKHSAKITGRKRSQEEKDKISLSMKGKKNRLGTVQSNETRLEMSRTRTGKFHSDETKALVGSYHKNKVVTDETRAKQSKSQKERYRVAIVRPKYIIINGE